MLLGPLPRACGDPSAPCPWVPAVLTPPPRAPRAPLPLLLPQDVVTFLSWAAEPEMDERKLMGAKWIAVMSLVRLSVCFLCCLVALLRLCGLVAAALLEELQPSLPV